MNDKHPKLYLPNEKGEYVPEYIPPAQFKFRNWFRWKYVKLLNYYGKDIYYWHIRHNHYPEYRKTTDIEFLLHVVKDHEYNPTDPTEKKHFDRAWKLYGKELQYVLGELAKDEGKEWENSEFVHGHPYAYGYKKQWFPKFPEMETKLTYHGVKFHELLDLNELSAERAKARMAEYCELHGLDPETGEKLSDKKPKKSRRKATKHDKSPTKESKNETL